MEKGDTALAVHGSTEQFGVRRPPTDGAIRITESSVILSVLPAASTTTAASTDSGISSAISEEDDVPGTGSSLAVAAAAKDDADIETVADVKVEHVKEASSSQTAGSQLPLVVATAQPPELKLERPKFNAKLKGNFEEVKRIALMIEKAVRHRLL